ncbi:hypothetical protein CBR_g37699 [Chara braunii]|uniref:Uncharacterized protein n=1 Tax=Chara braunii TaxID=69332 RepID=A0A388JZU6_CHABU|nr:hypothetical protein CBR_g37699 [Chara braunii]|eukprot:GBG63341.1 hypothetical protein CBR_g37699 [Chara braunii]
MQALCQSLSGAYVGSFTLQQPSDTPCEVSSSQGSDSGQIQAAGKSCGFWSPGHARTGGRLKAVANVEGLHSTFKKELPERGLAVLQGLSSPETAVHTPQTSRRRLHRSGRKAVVSMSAVPDEGRPPSAVTLATSETSEASMAADIMQRDAEVIVRTYARAPIVIVRGQGCKLYDAEGREYLDMAAGIAVNCLGHSDPTWVKAVSEQAATLAHVSNLYFTEPQVKLASRLVASSFADRIFFCNSGTEANEAAIKFARKYQRVKHAESTDPPPTDIVSFSNCFHGRTLGALALTWKEQYRTPFEPIMPGASFATFGDLDSAAQAIKKGRTAAVFVEPLQGEGGIHSATKQFLEGLRKMCDESGALLVFDEVQCGLGRTSRLWAHQAYDIYPDIMTVAKPLAGGLPIGAAFVTEAVASALSFGDHGSTFAGGPLVCHAALAVLDRIESDGFLEGVAKKGERLKRSLQDALSANKHVKEIRGVGLLVGIQLDVPAGPIIDAARESGVLAITAGKGDVVRLAPPLVIADEEIDFAVQVLANCIGKLP